MFSRHARLIYSLNMSSLAGKEPLPMVRLWLMHYQKGIGRTMAIFDLGVAGFALTPYMLTPYRGV
jgi:hypothetical protein